MKSEKEQANGAKKEIIDEDDYIDLDLDDELDYEDPADYLEAIYRFMQDDIQLIIRVNKKTGMQSLILRLIYLETKKTILERRQRCIHVAIADPQYGQAAEYHTQTMQNNEFDHDIFMIKSTEQLKNLNLSIEDRFFALKSWAECIVESDIGALLFQGQIDRFSNLQYPISHFIMKSLAMINLDYFFKYIDYIEKHCIFEGRKHESSIRANVLFLLNVIEQSDYLKNAEDPIKHDAVKKIINRLADIDKETVSTATSIWIKKLM